MTYRLHLANANRPKTDVSRLRRWSTGSLEVRLHGEGRKERPDDTLIEAIECVLAERAAGKPLPRRSSKPHRFPVSLPARWRAVVRERCALHGLPADRVLARGRAPDVVACRFDIWHAIRSRFGASYGEIGRRFGGYDHTSVYHGINKVEEAA